MVNLTRTRTVLDLLHAEGNEATFVRKDSVSLTHIGRMDIPRELWNQLGMPDKITVTVEPGNAIERGFDNGTDDSA